MSDNMTASAKIISKANETKTTTDSLGRVIEYKKLKVSEQMDLVALLGASLSMNPVGFNLATAAYRVVKVDGQPMPVRHPEDYTELLENMDFIGDEGINAMFALNRPQPKKKEEEVEEPVEDKVVSTKLDPKEVAEIAAKGKKKE